MDTLALHLEPGTDVRQSLEALARQEGGQGFVLSVVGNLSQAVFQCPGKAAPTRLRGELEIITLSGTLSPQGVHLHLSFSDGDCRVWGGHLEPGTLVLRGADLLVGFLPVAVETDLEREAAGSGFSEDATAGVRQPAAASPRPEAPAELTGPGAVQPQRVEIAVLPGCPWSERALRLLRTLAIPHRVITVDSEPLRAEIEQLSGSGSLPQVFVDGEPIGGYDALAESHGRRELEPLRQI